MIPCHMWKESGCLCLALQPPHRVPSLSLGHISLCLIGFYLSCIISLENKPHHFWYINYWKLFSPCYLSLTTVSLLPLWNSSILSLFFKILSLSKKKSLFGFRVFLILTFGGPRASFVHARSIYFILPYIIVIEALPWLSVRRCKILTKGKQALPFLEAVFLNFSIFPNVIPTKDGWITHTWCSLVNEKLRSINISLLSPAPTLQVPGMCFIMPIIGQPSRFSLLSVHDVFMMCEAHGQPWDLLTQHDVFLDSNSYNWPLGFCSLIINLDRYTVWKSSFGYKTHTTTSEFLCLIWNRISFFTL